MKKLIIDNIDGKHKEFNHYWSACVGAGRANEALRADWRRQFEHVVEACGFQSIRFHGIFHDDMFVYRSEYGSGFGPSSQLTEPVYTFSYVDKVFDYLIDHDVKPFVELGFMPSALATQQETVFWWGANCSPPKDMGLWCELVEHSVRHWTERYGIEAVREWRFEVWNEPNLVPFFWTGTKTQYFELYEHTVRTIKAIDSSLKVGGPATSVFVPDERYAGETEDRRCEVATAEATDVDALDWRPVWINEFIDYCADKGLPIDFISTHLYPTDNAFGANGEAVGISRQVNATYDDLEKLRAIIQASPYSDAELHITEWSHSPAARDPMHDSIFAATYIARTYLKCIGLADSLAYWTFTDIFEEGGAGIGPFHGGFGLINEQGIHKPTFHVFNMLNRLGTYLESCMPEGVVCSDENGAASGLWFNYPREMGTRPIGSVHTYEETRYLSEYGPAVHVHHEVSGLQPGDMYALETIDCQHGDVAAAWHEMGEPINLSRQQVEWLKIKADGLDRKKIQVNQAGVLIIDIDLAPWAVTSLYPLQ